MGILSAQSYNCKRDKGCSLGAIRAEGQSRTDFLLEAYRLIMQSNHFNFEFCQIRVNNRLNMEFLRHMLQDYKDLRVCDFLEFGFPMGCSEDINSLKQNFKVKNHKGAREFPLEIKSYLESEIDQGTVLGPFKSNPCESSIFLSPLNTVAKHDTNE